MTEEQSKHVTGIIEAFTDRAFDKYQKGAEQHGGFLGDKNPMWLLDQAIDEAIDQVVYLLTLKDKLDG